MQATDGKQASSELWPPLLKMAICTMLLLSTTAIGGSDSASSKLSLEIRAWSLMTSQQDDFVRGSRTAPVTLVTFTDFHCPFSKLAQSTIQALSVHYGSSVSFVHRDFPISSLHPYALQAHAAARCAAEQGGFWEYHDKILASPSNADSEQLMAYAYEAGMDGGLFLQCLESGRHEQSVLQDVNEGIRLGVNSTPTFFINGRILRGMHPMDSFMERIDAELLRQPDRTSLTSHSAEAPTTGPQ